MEASSKNRIDIVTDKSAESGESMGAQVIAEALKKQVTLLVS